MERIIELIHNTFDAVNNWVNSPVLDSPIYHGDVIILSAVPLAMAALGCSAYRAYKRDKGERK